jgi:site-specific recombinase XerD
MGRPTPCAEDAVMERRKTRGTVYARGNVLWIGWYDARGKRHLDPTELQVGQEKDAWKLLDAINRRVEAERRVGGDTGPLTVARYAETRWIPERRSSGIRTVRDDEARLRLHALPRIGGLLLTEVRPHHIRDLVRALKAEHKLAPRTMRHVYGLLHRLFEDARTDELVETNPCVLKRGELPRKADKDPTWRATAVFSRDEVEQLLSDPRISEYRRTIYAGMFLSGCRIGEWAARRWRDWDPTLRPLGRLMVATSFNRKDQEEKGVKTDNPRQVPVHEQLAAVLADWRQNGWARMFGRSPTPDDFITPSPRGGFLKDPTVLEWLKKDLAMLGCRGRRTHDSRRTFISLALADGADKHKLRWVTHGPPADIIDLYTTLPWETLCGQVAVLKIQRRPTSPHLPEPTPNPASCLDSAPGNPDELLQCCYRRDAPTKKPPSSENLEASSECPGRDSNPHTFRRHPLKMVCLPIPPPGRSAVFFNTRQPVHRNGFLRLGAG